MSKSNVITFNIILESRVVKKTGLFPVSLVVYFNGAKKRYRINKELTLSKEQWEKIQSPKLRDEKLKETKDTIEAIRIKANKVKDFLDKSYISFSFSEFEKHFFHKEKISSNRDFSFEECTLEYIREYKNHSRGKELSVKSKLMYQTTISSLNKFKAKLLLRQFTSDLLCKYENYLIENNKSVATIGIYLRLIRTIMNYSIKMKYLPQETYPFKDNFEIRTSEPNKRALNNDELKSLINYTAKNEQEQRALDFWKFSYLGNGMNFNDIARLKFDNIKGDVITFIRAKTKSKRKITREISIYLLPEMLKIIDKHKNLTVDTSSYLFSILKEDMNPLQQYKAIQQFIKTTNKYLKRISKALNFDFDCTTYYARHSWATKMRNEGVSLSFISEGLGHSTLSTTENYLGKFPVKDFKENAKKLLDL